MSTTSIHDPFHRFSDEELVALAAVKHREAHNAPRTGNTFAVRAEEWRKIMDEIDRRRIKLGSGDHEPKAGL